MRKLLFSLSLIFVSVFILSAQADYKMYAQIMLDPKLDQITTLEKNLAEHNKKFHSEGFRKATVWEITTGSNAGMYAWVMGPLTLTDFDSGKMSKEHDLDWNQNVLPYVKDVSEVEYWKMNDKLSYMPEGSSTGKEIFTVYNIKPFQSYRFKQILEKVIDVYKKKEYKDYFEVYYNEFSSNSNRDVAIAFGFRTWASLDEESTFMKDYEEIHGAGSWLFFMEEFKASVESFEDELSFLRPDLSVK